MSRKLVAAAIVAASVLGAAPSAFATAQKICHDQAVIHTGDMDIYYTRYYLCGP